MTREEYRYRIDTYYGDHPEPVWPAYSNSFEGAVKRGRRKIKGRLVGHQPASRVVVLDRGAPVYEITPTAETASP